LVLDSWSSLLLVSLLTNVGLAVFGIYVLRKPAVKRNVALGFLGLQLVLVVWLATRLLSYLSPYSGQSYLWLKVSFIPICLVGLAWLAATFAATGRTNWLAPRRLSILAIPGVLFSLLALTNDWHGQFLTAVLPNLGPGEITAVSGPLFWLQSGFSYLYVCASLVLLGHCFFNSTGWARWQAALLASASLPPLISNVLQVTGLVSTPIDLTPVTISAATIVCAACLFRLWLTDVAHVALARATAQIGVAVVVLDQYERVLDANPAFSELSGVARTDLVGRTIRQVLASVAASVAYLDQLVELANVLHWAPSRQFSADVCLRRPAGRTLEVTVWPIRGPSETLIGRMLTMRDVTQERKATGDLQKAVANLEAVHEAAIAMASVHDLGSILSLILNNLRRLAGAGQASIAILDPKDGSYVILADLDRTGQYEMMPSSDPPCRLTEEIMAGREALFVEEVEAEEGCRPSLMDAAVQAYAGVPLVIRNELVGILFATFDQPHAFPAEAQCLVKTLASHAAVAIYNAQMFNEIEQAVTTDALTGLPNHHHLMERLDEEIARAGRSGHPLAVLMIDIDDFRQVNDANERVIGDMMLKVVARLLEESLRTTDVLGRYGGDEFLAILPETDAAASLAVADRLVKRVRSEQFELPVACSESTSSAELGLWTAGAAGEPIACSPIRLSVGQAGFPYDSATRLELVSLAEAAMYSSKQAGGDTVTSARTTDSALLTAQNPTFSVLEGLITAVDAKDHYTRLHSEQVTRWALGLAEEIGLPPETKRMLRIAGLLHDVGKIGIPDHILYKPEPLDDDERRAVQQHPLLSEMIIREVPQLVDVLDAVRHHHERFDGTGYPRGLLGNEIPLLARVLAIADAYSAMTVDRPYRQALSDQEALAELEAGAGSQFDPELLQAFVKVLEKPDRLTEDTGLKLAV
jgi:diguanylate cyclase (GGDEF)-like protein/PAS domain S-box-containing protein